MQIERSDQYELSPEEQAHLEKLRRLVESALADGKVSEAEIQAVRALVHADHKVTPEELQTIRSTMREMLGDAALEYDWS
jgi:uncharacterized tellurite resistance protein B-like protein